MRITGSTQKPQAIHNLISNKFCLTPSHHAVNKLMWLGKLVHPVAAGTSVLPIDVSQPHGLDSYFVPPAPVCSFGWFMSINLFLQIGWGCSSLIVLGRTIGLASGGHALSNADCFSRLLHDTSRILLTPNLKKSHLKASLFRSLSSNSRFKRRGNIITARIRRPVLSIVPTSWEFLKP